MLWKKAINFKLSELQYLILPISLFHQAQEKGFYERYPTHLIPDVAFVYALLGLSPKKDSKFPLNSFFSVNGFTSNPLSELTGNEVKQPSWAVTLSLRSSGNKNSSILFIVKSFVDSAQQSGSTAKTTPSKSLRL